MLDTRNGSTPLAGAAIYLWHCDIDGRYSLYSQGVTNENYLRGVQESDASGSVTFEGIFSGAYAGRWPHIHFEARPSPTEATVAGTKLRTSQLALPEDCGRRRSCGGGNDRYAARPGLNAAKVTPRAATRSCGSRTRPRSR